MDEKYGLGVSVNDFNNLLEDIRVATVEEGSNALNDYSKLIEELRKEKPGEDTESWVDKFLEQVSRTDLLMKNNYKEIEILFKRLLNNYSEVDNNE